MKICVCDDNPSVCEELKKLIFDYADTPVTVDILPSGDDLVACYSSGKYYDIIFLDVEMPGISGIEAASEIRNLSEDAIIIFVSSHKGYVFDAFQCEALHFIVKPISHDEFEDVFRRALNKYRSTQIFFPLKWQNSRMNIKISDITYVESVHRHLRVHTEKQVFEAVGKLSDAYTELKNLGFVQVHQGYIVNMHYIQRFNSSDITLSDGTQIMMSRGKRPEALREYDRFLQKWKW